MDQISNYHYPISLDTNYIEQFHSVSEENPKKHSKKHSKRSSKRSSKRRSKNKSKSNNYALLTSKNSTIQKLRKNLSEQIKLLNQLALSEDRTV